MNTSVKGSIWIFDIFYSIIFQVVFFKPLCHIQRSYARDKVVFDRNEKFSPSSVAYRLLLPNTTDNL